VRPPDRFRFADRPGSTHPGARIAFYEQALAPLGFTLQLEFSGAAAGFGRDDGERPSFLIEAYGEPVRGRLHIALRAESRAQVDAFHAVAIQAGGTDNGAPGLRWYHPDCYGSYILDPDGHNIEAVCHSPDGSAAGLTAT
jgi:catechol 2,3-dioxygenase-like lactoylglutathione lyase family enzyme